MRFNASRPRCRRAAAGFCVFLVIGWTDRVGTQDAPLPTAEEFYARVRDNLARSGREQGRYGYKERRTELHTNPFGRLGTGDVLLYDVTPLGEGEGSARRLLERNGAPLAEPRTERVGPRPNRGQSQSRPVIEDAISVLTFTMDRRESREGRQTIVVRFSPKPNARARTRQGRIARSFTGEIWVDEAAHEVWRVEAVAVESISFGFGLIARLGKGAHVTLQREPVGDLWLPTFIRFEGEGRALLLRKLTIDYIVEWFDYRPVE